MATLAAKARRGALHTVEPIAPTQMQSSEDQTLVKESQGLVRRLIGYHARGLLSGHAYEDIEYEPMLPSRSFTVRVRYQLRGRGEPLPYPIDEE